jgi:hypothetical protein
MSLIQTVASIKPRSRSFRWVAINPFLLSLTSPLLLLSSLSRSHRSTIASLALSFTVCHAYSILIVEEHALQLTRPCFPSLALTAPTLRCLPKCSLPSFQSSSCPLSSLSKRLLRRCLLLSTLAASRSRLTTATSSSRSIWRSTLMKTDLVRLSLPHYWRYGSRGS